ncbi:photo-regulated tyrosinase [Histoplasma capsulatum var. duboisii H88]|uniref:tyrosinase n=1 Tax=Ajellomyces capsulatus (strain H88) TaxID=544711 RepID=A0A8A1L447_AJEC8|nr:photo-regulated tyrosinase [Histoplasma capsulatum var. duboisii H88]
MLRQIFGGPSKSPALQNHSSHTSREKNAPSTKMAGTNYKPPEYLSKRPYEYYAITGIKAGTVPDQKKAPIRQEIDEWSNNKANADQVDLFVMAWRNLMNTSPRERGSFFQVAGIHGQPYVPYDEPDTDLADIKDKGYCTHNNILFPIWHRPYLALLEQLLYENMISDIIPKFPKDKQTGLKEAADSWRLPFWDWAINHRVPTLAKYPTTTIPTPNGKRERVENPLYQFKMSTNEPFLSEGVGQVFDPWAGEGGKGMYFNFGPCIGTSRSPDIEDSQNPESETWKNGVVNNNQVGIALKSPGWMGDGKYGAASEMVYRLLTHPLDYPSFATTFRAKGQDDISKDINLEYIHNNVHGWVGGNYTGHMSEIPVATFDPLFWLHHCNIDRMWAIWQALNPDKWFETADKNTFFQEAIGLADTITPQTKLRPFHTDTKGTCWTPEGARDVLNFGYTYPELQTWDAKYNAGGAYNRDLHVTDIRKIINEKYGASRTELLKNPALGDKTDDGVKSNDFAFSVRYKKYALGGNPFTIKIYLAPGDGKPRTPESDYVTEVYNFSFPSIVDGKEVCSNCTSVEATDSKATSYLSITYVLVQCVKRGILASLDEATVTKFLQKNLYWRLYQRGRELGRFEMEKIELEVLGSFNTAQHHKDATILSGFKGFRDIPSLAGGPDGALDPKLKKKPAPPPTNPPAPPSAGLHLNSSLDLKSDLTADGVIILDSTSVDLNQIQTDTIDNTQVTFKNGNDTLFLISFRRAEGQIVFNTNLGGKWGPEERVSLDGKLKQPQAAIMVHDQGEGFEVSIDFVHVAWFKKRDPRPIKTLRYGTNKNQKPVLADVLKVSVYPSMQKVFTR